MAHIISEDREAIFAEEAFVVEVQGLLHEIMEEKGFSRADLARALDVSRARITQIFSDDCKNLTVRLLARVMHALGESPTLNCRSKLAEMQLRLEQATPPTTRATPSILRMWDDETDETDICWPANDNRLAGLARHYGMAA